jgi:hypothetical protein
LNVYGLSTWDLAGGALLLAFAYLALSQTLMPRLAIPIFGRKQRQRALDRLDQMLAEDGATDDERLRLLRCRNTLLADDNQFHEAWSGRLPVRDVIKEVDGLWESRPSNRVQSPDSQGRVASSRKEK